MRTLPPIAATDIRFRSLFEHTPELILYQNEASTILDANPAFLKLVKKPKDQVLNHPYDEFLPPNVRDFYREKLREVFATGLTVYFEMFASQGDSAPRHWDVMKVPLVENGRVVGVHMLARDITKRVESDKQLQLLALVAEGTVNGVVIAGADGRTEWVNAGFTKHTGYTVAEMVGRKCGHVLQGPETDPEAVRRFREGLQQDKPFSVTILNYTKTGEKLWLAIDVTPIYTDAGELTQFIAIQHNITLRKATEAHQAKMTQELYRHNRDLQQFTYIVSHNLRAPLANALGLAGLLTKGDKHHEVFDTSLRYLSQSLDQADAVLHDLNRILDLRDQQGGAQDRVALVDVCRQAIENLAAPLQQCAGQVTVAVPGDLAVRSNWAYVYSIFHNLLSNSIKYRAEGRQLLVEIAGCYSEQGGVSISFTDNGSGFDRAKAGADVFQLYKRFHPQQLGRGIGLFLVKTHVEVMGGTIEVTSEVGQGTQFLIQLDTY